MTAWKDVCAWRRQQRQKLLIERLNIPLAEKKSNSLKIAAKLKQTFPELAHACIGFCWPFRGEIDLRHVVGHFMDQGATAALPVVVQKGRPLEFWTWQPAMKLARGVWNIPIPRLRAPVQPTALLVPLVGFDPAGYRLGYGGGYFDRTLAVMPTKPLTIGVGYEICRLATIHPQPHDIPMDVIVTESQIEPFQREDIPDPLEDDDPNEIRTYASPPCFMHELDTSYFAGSNTKRSAAEPEPVNWAATDLKSRRRTQ